MSRTLNLRGTFTEGESRNLNGRILRNSSNPNPPPRVITSNDFDRYINILKANNRYPIPKELTLPIYTTPYTLDKDLYLAKDSVISFFGTSPAYLNKFSLSFNNTIYDISSKFVYTQNSINPGTGESDEDVTFIYIEYISNFYKITYIVHRASGASNVTIPANSYYYAKIGSYDGNTPVLTFYETDNDPILSIASVSTNGTEIYNSADILVSKSFVNFPFH